MLTLPLVQKYCQVLPLDNLSRRAQVPLWPAGRGQLPLAVLQVVLRERQAGAAHVRGHPGPGGRPRRLRLRPRGRGGVPGCLQEVLGHGSLRRHPGGQRHAHAGTV